METLNRYDWLVAVSKATLEWHVAQGLDSRKVTVLYNGVDVEEFKPRPKTGWLHEELGLPQGTQLVGAVGQLGPRKGTDILLSAAENWVQELPRVQLLIAGSRFSTKRESVEFEARCRERVRGGLLRGRVHLLGQRGDISSILNELDVLVHAARQEPLGRVLLEGGASGVAIVAAATGGTLEIFPPDRGAARLVPSGDSASLSSAVKEVMNDEAGRRGMGLAAREVVLGRFEAGHQAGLLSDLYSLILVRRGRTK
jgi:glycosyltransferase involved in cell wall biosynthesis